MCFDCRVIGVWIDLPVHFICKECRVCHLFDSQTHGNKPANNVGFEIGYAKPHTPEGLTSRLVGLVVEFESEYCTYSNVAFVRTAGKL